MALKIVFDVQPFYIGDFFYSKGTFAEMPFCYVMMLSIDCEGITISKEGETQHCQQ
jgi:hypothetical protein